MKWLFRLKEYWNDKKLSEKCGMDIKDICVHEIDTSDRFININSFKCTKCGRLYR
jgi:hypothetical protein